MLRAVIAMEGVPYLTSARNCNYLASCVNADRSVGDKLASLVEPSELY